MHDFGPLLGPTDFGVAAGQPLADASSVPLPDGRLRMYIYAQGRGIVSAVSVSADGTSFVPEAGSRLPDGSGMPRTVVNPAGGWRLYVTSGSGIKSAVSTDGLTFTVEDGFRITAEAAAFTGTNVSATSGATVIRLADGRYRMYFSDLPRPGDPPGGHRIKSAVSTDQVRWTMEEGVRVGPGAPVLTESAEHLKPTTSSSATIRMRCVSDGTLVMYDGQFDPQVGGTINLARCPEPAAGS